MNNVGDLYYDPETGKLYRIKELKCTADDDTTNGIRGWGRNVQATHAMFFIMTGRWPESGMIIDHIDGDSSNNRWENLREATVAQNAQNRQEPGRYIKTEEVLERCVYQVGQRFKVVVNGINCGTFDSSIIANSIARQRREELQGEFMRRVP